MLSGLFRYGESELEPAVQAEILLESARNEARAAVLEILAAVGYGVWESFRGPAFRAVAIFATVMVIPLLADAQMRRSAAKRLLGLAPHPPKPVKKSD